MNTNEEITATLDNLEVLIEMVMDRDAGDALRMVTMIHEVAKLYAADQLPKAEKVTTYGFHTDETLEVIFSGRNVRTARNLITHLKLELDDDGIPI